MKVRYLIEKGHIHQSSPSPRPRARHPISGPLKSKVVQSIEEPLDRNKMQNDQTMTALVNLAKKRF
eukprot:7615441-Prorocentrum_lima.AAC.1